MSAVAYVLHSECCLACFKVWPSPRLLHAQLNYLGIVVFVTNAWSVQDDRPVNFGDGVLDMSPYLAQALSRPQLYELSGVVDHAGGTGSGHYMARCKSAISGKWYRANDSTVTEGSSLYDLQMAGMLPYMLIYHLKA